MGRSYIGTSGWQYAHWRGSFYPEGLPQKDWLRYYAKYFDTVEVNSSFYRQTRASTFQKWQSEVPAGFIFAIKGNRFITHIKRLKNCEEPVKIFFEAANSLGGRTSREVRPHREKHVVLWQLPPNLAFDELRLKNFLALLPRTWRHAFEFRHQSWVREKTWQILKKYNAAAVFQDWREWPIIQKSTADFVYLRFHGKDVLYTSNYTDEELKEWAGKLKKWAKDKDIYAYFNNDAACYAVPNTLSLKKQLVISN